MLNWGAVWLSELGGCDQGDDVHAEQTAGRVSHPQFLARL